MAELLTPMHVFFELSLEADLAYLGKSAGVEVPAIVLSPGAPMPDLEKIYDDEVEAAVRAAYRRDYMMFGFDRWKMQGD